MERGTPTKPRTVELPTNSATGTDLVTLTEVNDPNIVSVAVSYQDAIAFLWAKDVTTADAEFAKGSYMVYRSGDTQHEIPARGAPGILFIRRFGPGAALPGGLSYHFIQGAERL